MFVSTIASLIGSSILFDIDFMIYHAPLSFYYIPNVTFDREIKR